MVNAKEPRIIDPVPHVYRRVAISHPFSGGGLID